MPIVYYIHDNRTTTINNVILLIVQYVPIGWAFMYKKKKKLFNKKLDTLNLNWWKNEHT